MSQRSTYRKRSRNFVARDGPVRPLRHAVRVAVVDEAALEDRLADLAEGVVYHAVAERRGGDEPVLGVEHLDDRVAPGPVPTRREFPFEAEDLRLQVREEGGHAGFGPLPLRRAQSRRPERGEGGDRLKQVAGSGGHGGSSSRRRPGAPSRRASGRRIHSAARRDGAGRGRAA